MLIKFKININIKISTYGLKYKNYKGGSVVLPTSLRVLYRLKAVIYTSVFCT